MALPSGTRLNTFEILGPIGSGGMGEVYRARDTRLNRTVAIKVISHELACDRIARERFLREAQAMATVEHPRLVRIYSFGEHADSVYLVMEYIEGESLADRIRRLKRLEIDEALPIVRGIAEGLEAAWDRGIVHRDIKPANILLDAKDQVHVTDFGLSKAIRSATDETMLTQTTQVIGTPQYLSPEQARGEKADLRSDVYSLGILFYEMITGAPPFQGSTAVEVIAQHLHSPLPALEQRCPDIPAKLLRLIEQMTEKDPGRRPQSYGELLKTISDVAEPVPAWTGGSPYRGLAAFDLEHAPIFFGRARATEDVVNALRAQASDSRAFVVVLGMSGSGKSSLVRAGVIPALMRSGAIDGVGLWRIAILRPGEGAGDLFDRLASALVHPENALPELGADGTTADELGKLLRQNPKGAALLVKGGLSQAATELKRSKGLKEQPEARLVLLVDQMEELFTQDTVTSRDRTAFIDAISALARSGRVWVVGTLRSDFYNRCEDLPELMALKDGAGQCHLLPPTAAEIGQMIRLPALAAGLRFEVEPATQLGLDEVLRDAAAGQTGNLPFLEFALEERIGSGPRMES